MTVLKCKELCYYACMLAAASFSSMLYLMFNPNKSNIINNFESLLDNNQKRRYKDIVNYRLTIYILGLLLGLIIGFIYLNTIATTNISRVCIFTVLVLGINYTFYMIIPKNDYIIKHLNTNEQIEAWLDVYTEMKYRNYLGFILGIITYILISYIY